MRSNLIINLSIIAISIVVRNASAADVTFREDFDSDQLQAGWQIVHEDAANHSLTARPGFLRIITQRGALEAGKQVSNLFFRQIDGNFIIESHVDFDPEAGEQFAGLAVYSDDQHAVALGLAYASGARGTFRGIVLVSVGDSNSSSQRPGQRYDSSTTSTPNSVYLRLLRNGDQLVAGFSEDGINYSDIGSVNNPLPSSVLVGMGATNGDFDGCTTECDTGIPADFDFFQIRALTGSGNGGGNTDVPTLDHLTLMLPNSVDSGATASLSVIASFSDGSSRDVTANATWIVAPTGLGTIDNAGSLTAASVDNTTQMTVVASYTQLTSDGVSITKTVSGLLRINGTNPQTPSPTGCFAGAIGLTIFAAFCSLFLNRGKRSVA